VEICVFERLYAVLLRVAEQTFLCENDIGFVRDAEIRPPVPDENRAVACAVGCSAGAFASAGARRAALNLMGMAEAVMAQAALNEPVGPNGQPAEARPQQHAADEIIDAIANDDKLDPSGIAKLREGKEGWVDLQPVQRFVKLGQACVHKLDLTPHTFGGTDLASLP